MRYSNVCLRLFLQDLHGLQRFYHNVDFWGIRLYHHTNLLELLLVKYSNACLRLFDKIYIVYRDLITTLTIGALHFIISIFTFSGAFISEIQ